MREVSAAAQAALENRDARLRDFIWFSVRDRITDNVVEVGYWSDVGPIDAQIIDPATQLTQVRSFSGAGSLISVGAIPLVSNLSVQTVTVELSQVSDADALIRGYDARQGRVEIYRGLFARGSYVQLAPAFARFVGYIDGIDFNTPSAGEEGAISLECVSHTQELSRSNPATRSDAHQRLRSPSDSFRRHAAAVAGWEIKWGTAS